MSFRIITSQHPFLEAASATDAGKRMNVADYRHIMLYFATDGDSNADLTAKVQGSIAPVNSAPDWDAVQSVTNQWDHVAMYDINDPSSIVTGDTGFVVSVADDYKNYLVNVDGLTWLNVEITARADGELTVVGVAFTNE